MISNCELLWSEGKASPVGYGARSFILGVKQEEEIPQYREKVELLKSAPGVGQVTAVTLIAELPQLGQVNRKEIAAMVGVAPINRESDKWKGKSSIQRSSTNKARVKTDGEYDIKLTAVELERNP